MQTLAELRLITAWSSGPSSTSYSRAILAEELGASRAQVALAWTPLDPAVVSPIMGARTLAQAEDNFEALKFSLSADQVERLNAASAPPPVFPERFIGRPMAQQLIFGKATVTGRR